MAGMMTKTKGALLCIQNESQENRLLSLSSLSTWDVSENYLDNSLMAAAGLLCPKFPDSLREIIFAPSPKVALKNLDLTAHWSLKKHGSPQPAVSWGAVTSQQNKAKIVWFFSGSAGRWKSVSIWHSELAWWCVSQERWIRIESPLPSNLLAWQTSWKGLEAKCNNDDYMAKLSARRKKIKLLQSANSCWIINAHNN